MDQDFKPHPVLVNYEESCDGVIRNCRLNNPVGVVNNRGYLRFTVGKKTYYCHRFAYECRNGLIKDGFVVDHKNGVRTDNYLENHQAISQSENIKRGRTGKHVKQPKSVKSFDSATSEEKIFQSMSAAGKYFDICIPSVRFVAEGIRKSAVSKKWT